MATKNSINSNIPIEVTLGGTGIVSPTDHVLIVGSGAAAMTELGVGTTNNVLTGVTGADPAWAQVDLASMITGTLPVGNGGTGLTAPTDHSVLVGSGAGNITPLTVGTNGQVIVGSTGADPVFANISSTDSSITITEGAGTLVIEGTAASVTQVGSVELTTDAEAIAGADTTRAITSEALKAKLGTQTDHGVLVGSGTAAAVTALAVGTDGQVLLGSTGADPVFATLTSSGGTITFTPGAGTLNLETAASGFAWSEVTGTSQAIAVGNGYILNNGALVTATLPATAAVGSLIEIVGKGAGGWLVAQNASQTIHFIGSDTTTGAGGSLASTNRYDSISLVCITADTDFVVKSSVGNITVV